jgi:hypothetical protein
MMQNKAENFADELATGFIGDGLLIAVQRELRRLSPMEAERDKLLEVNKVLERSHKLMLALVLDDESKATKEQLAESVEICKSLKLAGKIK